MAIPFLTRDQLRRVVQEGLLPAVDQLVAKTPSIWDDMVWKGARSTILSDGMIDKAFDFLVSKGIIMKGGEASPRESP